VSALKIVALLLIAAGVVGLLYGGFTYTKTTHDAKVGPFEFSIKDKERSTSRYGRASGRSWSAAYCSRAPEGLAAPTSAPDLHHGALNAAPRAARKAVGQ